MPDSPISDDLAAVAHLASPVALGARVIPNFRARPQQALISHSLVEALKNALSGNGPRFLAVSYPQQQGKSTITSILAPAWWLELHSLGIVPGGLVGLMSYEDSLSQSWSIKVRRLIEANPDIFYSTLRKDSKAAGYWETEQGGGIIAIGTAGSIQGRPISLLGIDDPTKNLEMALSPNHQNKIWELWTSVLFGRLQPWTVVLVTMARMASDDFIGRLADREYEGDPASWKFIKIPYLADTEDDPLSRPIGQPLIRPQADMTLEQAYEEARITQESVSTYSFSALWQQDPTNPEGTIFPEDKWRYWGGDSRDERDLPVILPSEFDVILQSWDMAFKDEKHHDWVVGQVWGAKGEDRYLIDQVRGHWGFTETVDRVKFLAAKTRAKYPKARAILVEDKANGTAVINILRSKVGGLIEITPEESKLSRAWSCQPLQLGGNLYLPAPSVHPWVRQFTKECLDFRGDGSGHDDQVDTMTQALNYLMFFRQSQVSMLTATDPIPQRPGGIVAATHIAAPRRRIY